MTKYNFSIELRCFNKQKCLDVETLRRKHGIFGVKRKGVQTRVDYEVEQTSQQTTLQ